MSSASARYHDRWVDAKLIIITTVLEIEDFFRRIGCRDEPIRQLKRRCKIMIRLTIEKMELYAYYNMALRVQGNVKYIPHDDYRQDISQSLANDDFVDPATTPAFTEKEKTEPGCILI